MPGPRDDLVMLVFVGAIVVWWLVALALWVAPVVTA